MLLIDAGRREPEPPPPPPPRALWRPGDVEWRALRWPALMVALFLAGLLTAGWPSVGLIYATLVVACWRGSRLLAPHLVGMREHSQ